MLKGHELSAVALQPSTDKNGILMVIFINSIFIRASLLRKCWHQDPGLRPKPSEIVKTLIENPELVRACVDVPGTTLMDNSLENFDFRNTPAHARGGMGSPHSSHLMSTEHLSSTLTLTHKEQEDSVIRKHNVKPGAGRKKRQPASLWRKSSVHF